MLNCSKCGHSDGMHGEDGCVALDCSSNQCSPAQNVPAPKNIKPFVQPPRPPLNVPRYAR